MGLGIGGDEIGTAQAVGRRLPASSSERRPEHARSYIGLKVLTNLL